MSLQLTPTHEATSQADGVRTVRRARKDDHASRTCRRAHRIGSRVVAATVVAAKSDASSSTCSAM